MPKSQASLRADKVRWLLAHQDWWVDPVRLRQQMLDAGLFSSSTRPTDMELGVRKALEIARSVLRTGKTLQGRRLR